MEDSMKKIRTVRGDIAPEELGLTSMHDHTFVDLGVIPLRMKAQHCADFLDAFISKMQSDIITAFLNLRGQII